MRPQEQDRPEGAGSATVRPRQPVSTPITIANDDATTPPKTKSSAQHAVRQPPRGILLPSGWRKIWFWISWNLFKRNYVPRPSEHQVEEATIEWYQTRIRLLARATPLCVTLANYKGGGSKTVSAVILSRLASNISGLVVYLVAAFDIPGSTAKKAGTPETLAIYEFATGLDKYQFASDLTDDVALNGDNVRVIGPNQRKRGLSGEQFTAANDRLGTIANIRVLDTGNNTEGVELAAVKAADVVVFTCTTTVPDSLDLMGYTIDEYRKVPELAEKVKNSVVAVCAIEPGHELDNYTQYATRVGSTQNEDSLELNPEVRTRDFSGHVIGVPWDKHLRSADAPTLDQLEPKTLIAYLELLELLYVKTAHSKGKGDNIEAIDKWMAAKCLNGWSPRKQAVQLSSTAGVQPSQGVTEPSEQAAQSDATAPVQYPRLPWSDDSQGFSTFEHELPPGSSHQTS